VRLRLARSLRTALRAAGLALSLAAFLGASGCGTCRPGDARVEPRVGGSVGVGSGGSWHESFLGLDLSNLFCRPPRESPPPADTPPPEEALPPRAGGAR
jgi:hypothetical protein